jgi:hypothetical protein
MIYLHVRFHMPSFNVSFLSPIRTTRKYRFPLTKKTDEKCIRKCRLEDGSDLQN